MAKYEIYKTTNLLNGMIYVGKDKRSRPGYLGSGTHLKRALLKYGKENFMKEILEACNNEETLNERERHWIKELRAQDPAIGYNILEGGQGGDSETCSKNITAWWSKMNSEEKKAFNSGNQRIRWARASEEQKTQSTLAANASRSSEDRKQTGKEVALKHFTPEEISRRSKKGWANLSPEDRAKRAKLMKTKKEVQNG